MSFTQHQRSVCSVGHVGFGRGTTAGRRGAWRLARSGKSKMALKKGSNWMELVDAPWFCTIFHFFLSDDCSMCFFSMFPMLPSWFDALSGHTSAWQVFRSSCSRSPCSNSTSRKPAHQRLAGVIGLTMGFIWIHTVVVNFMVVLNSGELIMANDG